MQSARVVSRPLNAYLNILIAKTDTDTAMIENLPKEAITKISSMHPFNGLGNPEDIASVAVFLASNDAKWVTGISMAVDGGYTCQ